MGALMLVADASGLAMGWLHSVAAFLLLSLPACAVAEKVLASRRRGPSGSVASRGAGHDSSEWPAPAGVRATRTADCAVCSAAAAVRALLPSDPDEADALELWQVAHTLARQACRLSGADAAWVYRVENDGAGIDILSDHHEPVVADRVRDLAGGARRLVEEVAFVYGLGVTGDRRTSQAVTDGDYAAIPVLCRGRLQAVVAVHGGHTQRSSHAPRPASLSSLASEASVVVENALLYQSQKDILANLRQFEVHRTDYASTVAHELRTPLTSIKGFAQLLMRRGELPVPEVQSYAATIAAEADKLSRIVSDILELTRMETGLLELRRDQVCPTRLVEGVVDALPAGPSKSLLRVNLPESLPAVRGDPERLSQVLRWLVSDSLSRSYLDAPVGLTLAPDQEGVVVSLEYAAADDQVEQLLEALEGPTQDDGDGEATKLGRGGLGMYISKNFVEAHGGKLWVERPGDQVARVAFTLPY